MKDWKFKYTDFNDSVLGGFTTEDYAIRAANLANFVLEQWLSKATVVYGHIREVSSSPKTPFVKRFADRNNFFYGIPDTHKALLINIEPIKKCKHPYEKINKTTVMSGDLEPRQVFKCECGAKVKPITFIEE